MGPIDAKPFTKRFTRVVLLILLGVLPASAQVDKKCSGRVYSAREVTKRAKIIEEPKLHIGLLESLGRARFLLEAVLCRSGQVTDIRVIEGVSPEINEFAIAAISLVKFEPAELRWHSVSQRMRFQLEFGPNEPGLKLSVSADAAGQLVESVDIVGNRSLLANKILSWIKTRPGDAYSEEKLKRDFDALLATGYFDKTQTRAMIDTGVRGGVTVIFEVVELPLMTEINYDGLGVHRSILVEALKKDGLVPQLGEPFDIERLKKALRVMDEILASLGEKFSFVELQMERVNEMAIKLRFEIISKR